jgi:hypothetical protein
MELEPLNEVDWFTAGTSAALAGGGSTSTMLSHFGQARIWPMNDGSVTRSRALHVVQ